jgi:hypothetical protein
MRIFLFLFLGVMCLTFVREEAFAQSFPEFSLGDAMVEPAEASDTNEEDDIDFVIESRLMRDILLLQEQVNILDAMVQRQAEIQKIASNYEGVGINFKQPLPPAETCAKIPLNLLCLYAYPDMDQHTSFMEEQAQRVEEMQQEAMNKAIANITQSMGQMPPLSGGQQAMATDVSFDQGMIFDPAPASSFKDDYLWSDIRCAVGKCSALIVSSLDSSKRFRVEKGDKIEGNIAIKDINIGGVQVSHEQEGDVFLSPLPVGGAGDSVDLAGAGRSAGIANILGREMDSSASRMEAPDILSDLDQVTSDVSRVNPLGAATGISTPPQDFFGQMTSDDSPPLLGPTGLF